MDGERKTSEMINIGDSGYEIKKDDFIENKDSDTMERSVSKNSIFRV